VGVRFSHSLLTEESETLNRCFKAFSFFQKAKGIKKVSNHMFETSEEGGNLAQMRLIWYQKVLQIQLGAVERYN